MASRRGPKRRRYRDHSRKWFEDVKGSVRKHEKHEGRKLARLYASRARGYEHMRQAVCAMVESSGLELPVPATVQFFGGACPFQGWGEISGGEGTSWYFRFRGDHASLEIQTEDVDGPDGWPVCHLMAARANLTGDPWSGSLYDWEAEQLMVQLWSELAPPLPGERHIEQLSAAISDIQARYGLAGSGKAEQEPVGAAVVSDATANEEWATFLS